MYIYWKSYFQERRFIVFSTLLVIALILLQCFFSKAELFILANGFHTTALDNFFTGFTYLGDGLFCISICIILFFTNRKISYRLGISFLLSGLVAQLLKSLFQAPRPKTYFAEGVYSYFIEGVTHTGNSSFPSGHTTTAFVTMAVLSSCTKNNYCILLLLLIAFGVGYSRVYLGQHFVQDVAAGAVIGLLTAIIVENLQRVINLRPVSGKKYLARINKPAEPVYLEA
ncbi:MAG: phosphatase PAP2 family protein [Chitinophagaceae bacterium]